MKKFLPAAGIAVAVMALGACASQSGNSVASNQKAKQKTAKQNQMVCFRQATLGSHIGSTYCVTQQQYAQMQKEHSTERVQTQQQLQQMGSNGNCTGQSGGCVGPGGGPPQELR